MHKKKEKVFVVGARLVASFTGKAFTISATNAAGIFENYDLRNAVKMGHINKLSDAIEMCVGCIARKRAIETIIT